MNDYISRAAAIESLEDIDWYHINQNGELVSGANSQEHEPLYKESDIYAALAVVPTADVVEVVRCKDCCFWDRDTIRQNSNDVSWWNEAVCKQHSRYGNETYESWTDADWYCADGERRTDG